MTDEDLIDAIRRGDRDAFGVLIARHQRMVEAAAYAATGRQDLVDDIVQDTFVTAWRTIDRLRDADALRPWLYGIAKHLGFKALRGRRAVATELESSPTQLDVMVERERDAEIAAALARLPRRYREPLVLFYYEHCTVREVADALAMRESAVMQRLSRGRRKLGDRLGRVESVLESKKSKVAIAALLLLLPERAASASPWRYWRPLGAVVATAGATAVLVLGVSRSSELHARELARTPPAIAAPPRPVLPEDHTHDLIVTSPLEPTIDDPAHVYRVMSLGADTAFETCARGARAVVMAALGKDAWQLEDGVQYYRPSSALLAVANAAGERAALTCGGDWPESYVVCEGTLADIQNGTINCFPFDAFHDALDDAFSHPR